MVPPTLYMRDWLISPRWLIQSVPAVSLIKTGGETAELSCFLKCSLLYSAGSLRLPEVFKTVFSLLIQIFAEGTLPSFSNFNISQIEYFLKLSNFYTIAQWKNEGIRRTKRACLHASCVAVESHGYVLTAFCINIESIPVQRTNCFLASGYILRTV